MKITNVPIHKKVLFFISLALVCFFITPSVAHGATRYWVGGGSSVNWNATGNTNWGTASNTQDNASVPTSSDDVFFDGVGTGASNSTLSADITIRSLNMTGYVNTLTHNSAVTLFIGDGTAGASNNALIIPNAITYTLGDAITSAISFISTSATQQNVNFNNKTTGNITFNGAGGSWQLTGVLTTGSTATVTVTQGAFSTGSQALNTGFFNSSNTNARTLTLNGITSSITLSGGNGTVWNLATTTNLTFTPGTNSITVTGGANVTFAGGGLTYGGVSFGGSGTVTITGANTFSSLTRTGTAVKTDALSLAANQTVTSSLTLNGNSTTNRLLITSDTLGTARTITNNGFSLTASYVDFRDITGAGSFSWNIASITGNSGNAGGNSGITFTTAATQTWNNTVGGNWSGVSWGVGRIPLPQDDVVISQAFSASQTITADMPRLGKSINWTGSSGSPAFAINSTPNTIYGSLTLISGMTVTTGQTTIFEGRSSFTLTSATRSLGAVTVQMIGGTLTLQDAFSATGTLTLNNGTLAANNQNITASAFSSSNANTRVITMGSGTWTLSGTATVWDISTATGLTLTENTSTITISDISSTSKTFAGGGETYYDLSITGSGTGAVIFTGANTFNNFTIGPPKTVTLPASTTTTISGTFSCTGTLGNVITLNSSSGGVQHTLSKSSGTVNCDYMSIQDSAATGGATWNAGSNSTSVSNNTGWSFGSPTYDQKHFRFYRDNAGLNSADSYTSEDTNYNIGVGTTFRLRIEVANTGAGAGNIIRRLEFKEDAGGWTQITTGTNNIRLSDSANFSDGAATTTRLTAVGTFIAGQGKDTASDTSSISLTNAYYTEDEYSLILQAGATGHTYTFRITNAGVALNTYTVTPAINAPDSTPPVPSGFNPANGATIKTATPNITYVLDEAGDCKASTTNASYSAMSGADCSGDGSTLGACLMPTLGSDGSKTIYVACQDIWGNQDTSLTTHSVTYTLSASSGLWAILTIKGLGKFRGSGVMR